MPLCCLYKDSAQPGKNRPSPLGTKTGDLKSPFPRCASLVKSCWSAAGQRGRCCRGGCWVHVGPMGGGWEGRGIPEWALNDYGLERMKMTSVGADGWSPAVEIELRRFTGLGRNSTVWW
jgi:hypothetical protein